VFIDHKSRTDLIADGGAIDRISRGHHPFEPRGDRPGARDLRLLGIADPHRFTARGADGITHHPFRGDAIDVWGTVRPG
jgi:hypothetical protein